jgi:hypothetical protein
MLRERTGQRVRHSGLAGIVKDVRLRDREARGEDRDEGLSSGITAGCGARIDKASEGWARSGSKVRWGQV